MSMLRSRRDFSELGDSHLVSFCLMNQVYRAAGQRSRARSDQLLQAETFWDKQDWDCIAAIFRSLTVPTAISKQHTITAVN